MQVKKTANRIYKRPMQVVDQPIVKIEIAFVIWALLNKAPKILSESSETKCFFFS